MRSLQNANDAGLKSTRSVSVVASSEGSKEVDSLQNELQSSSSDDDYLYTTKRWNILTIVFSVGLVVLIALHVMKTRRDRNKTDRQVCHSLFHDQIVGIIDLLIHPRLFLSLISVTSRMFRDVKTR